VLGRGGGGPGQYWGVSVMGPLNNRPPARLPDAGP